MPILSPAELARLLPGYAPHTLEEFARAIDDVVGYVRAPAPPDPSPHFKDLEAGARQAAAALRALHDQGWPLDIWPLEDGHTTPADILRTLDGLKVWAEWSLEIHRGERGRPKKPRNVQAARGIAKAVELILGEPPKATRDSSFERVLAEVLGIGPDGAHLLAQKVAKLRQGKK